MLELPPEICSDFAASASREWLETNGIGGYASSTISGANTRRYHGLLTAATDPPLGRVVMLSRLEEVLFIDGQRYDLSTNFYPGTVHPEGYRHLSRFRLDPYPKWTYLIDGLEIERSIFMVHGENTSVIRWAAVGPTVEGRRIQLVASPLIAFRDHHHLRKDRDDFNEAYSVDGQVISLRPSPGFPALWLAHNAASLTDTGDWFHNFEFPIEHERGFDHHEDLFQPFSLGFDLGSEAILIASDRRHDVSAGAKFERTEVRRRANLVARAQLDRSELWPLVLAADQFIVERGKGKTVIAGYPWFSDWGRDTMIALPGLCLATGRHDVAREILAEFAQHISEGMIPNRFPDEGEMPDYNTVDATLWYIEAVRAYLGATGDLTFVKDRLYKGLGEIIDHHIAGTRYKIHVDDDGLLYAGQPGTQLTWMDAKVGNMVITPRTGKPVEIQALWYNALETMAEFAGSFGDQDRVTKCRSLAAKARKSFDAQFWNEEEACLYDVIDRDQNDPSIRPNQIFAVSLTHSIIEGPRAAAVVAKVETDLLTPFGLRTLSPRDARYVGTYIGSPLERDSGYHQGTVWPWLVGHFVDAYRKVHSQDTEVEERVTSFLTSLLDHLSDAGVGQLSEIFDADPPHSPRGCPAQAWSVAEVLRSSIRVR